MISSIQLAMRNKKKLETISTAGCYQCLKTFNSNQVKEFTDQGETALCPFCGIDAVLPMENINEEYLIEVKKYWFD